MKLLIQNILSLTLFVILILFSGCEDFKLGDNFLDKPSSIDVNIDTVYSKKVYAEEALAQVYHSLPGFFCNEGRLKIMLLESVTDLATSSKSGMMYDYFGWLDASAPESSVAYRLSNDKYNRGPISGIRDAYLFIENVDRVPDMTKEEKEIRKAEAKLIIAFHNSEMLRYFGGMPWIGHSYSVNDDFKTERLPVAQYVDSIVGLIDKAAKILPWSVSAEDDGRMTKAAAMALKVRVLLYAASPLFNSDQPYLDGEAADKKIVWYGNYDKSRWQRALDAGLNFIAEKNKNGKYDLVNTGNPRADFQAAYFNRGNGEILLSSRWWLTWNPGTWTFNEVRYGICTPNLNLVDMYPMADGTDFSWNNPVHASNPFFKNNVPVRDIRLYETCLVNDDAYQGRKSENWVGGREYNTFFYTRGTGFGMRKYIQDLRTPSGKFSVFALIRLPEIYLSIAEAYNELDNPTEAYRYVAMVRNRVGLPGLKTGMSKSEIREAILRERALELAFEEVRYHDLMRWKRKDIWETTAVPKALTIYKASDGSYTYEQRPALNLRNSGVDWNVRNFLEPLPVAEINKKYGLIQNPGW